jgi:uncharacterized protein (DUF3820 family)
MGSTTSISQFDKDDLSWYLSTQDFKLPNAIPHKEVLAHVTGVLLDTGHSNKLAPLYKTATDVLRLAVCMSDGDVSLAENTKFRTFKRPERRFLLGLIEQSTNPTEDMARRRSVWLRLGEKLHPGEYKRFPKARKAFKDLRESKARTYNSKVEQAFLQDMDAAIELLTKHPGDFARRLDHILRCVSTEEHPKVLSKFGTIMSDISTPVLLQLSEHFNKRDTAKGGDCRVFFPKGNIARAKIIDNELPGIPGALSTSIVKMCDTALGDRFKELDPLGKVYVDPALRGYLVPFSQRSASKALKTISRGSKIPFQAEKDILRMFIWWKDMNHNGYNSRVDLDLSVQFFNDEWQDTGHVSYTRLRDEKAGTYHSGDITSAPEGAAEFIDMNLGKLAEKGIRYAVMVVLSFTGQKFIDLPECFAGWMERKEMGAGRIFEPKTVTQKFDLTATDRTAVPVVFDIVNRVAIWTDLSLSSRAAKPINIESNSVGINSITKAIASMHKPDLYHLFSLHAEARGELVDSPEDADIVFSVSSGITPMDVETIMGEYL